jgi:hypothetical protein
MKKEIKPEIYRDIIDELVDMCHNGQGNIGAKRAVEGIWNENAKPDFIEDQYKINLLLAKLNREDRKTLAELLSHEVQVGVFETLKVLEQYRIALLEDGYEGSPYNDYVGRVEG